MTIAIVICGIFMLLLYAMSFGVLVRDYGRLPTDQAAAFMGAIVVLVSWFSTIIFTILVLIGFKPAPTAMLVIGLTAVFAPLVGVAASFLIKRATERAAMIGAIVGALAGIALFVLVLCK
jgi:hypothetical protein